MSVVGCILGAKIMKTIKQIADEIGVTKQALQKRLTREPLKSCLYPYIDTKSGTKYIALEGEKLIRAAFGADTPTAASIPVSIPTGTDVDSAVYSAFEALREQLQVKDAQLMEKDKQLAIVQQALTDTTAALRAAQQTAQAAQALHAGTIHQQITDGAEQSEITALGPADREGSERSPEEKPKKRIGVFARIFGNK